jgi:hypothetical protein
LAAHSYPLSQPQVRHELGEFSGVFCLADKAAKWMALA